MKHRTTELEGARLDHAVALAEGLAVASVDDVRGCQLREPHPVHGTTYFMPQTWEHGGPIVQRERIWLTAWPQNAWSADIPGEPGNPNWNPDVDPEPKPGEPGHVRGSGYGPTPLIAAMRAFVAAKLGQEVEIP